MEISYEQAKKNYENKDLANSLPFVLQEAKAGNQEMLYALGTMYENGLGVEQNENEAVNNYKSAADKGSSKAQFKLGTFLITGTHIQQNIEKGIEFLKQSAKSGEAAAQYNLGYIILGYIILCYVILYKKW